MQIFSRSARFSITSEENLMSVADFYEEKSFCEDFEKVDMCKNYALQVDESKIPWIIDLAGSMHVTCEKLNFYNFKSNPNCTIVLPDKTEVHGAGVGDIILNLDVNGTMTTRMVKRIIYAPNLPYNVISIPALVRKGSKVIFKTDMLKIFNGKELVAAGNLKKGVFYLNTWNERNTIYSKTFEVFRLWHRRLGHPENESLFELLQANYVFGNNSKEEKEVRSNFKCDFCDSGMKTTLPLPKSKTRIRLNLVYYDLSIKVRPQSFNEKNYYLIFRDDCTSKSWTYFLKHKNEILPMFKKFKTEVENETGERIKTLRTYNNTGYRNLKFELFLLLSGIRHEVSTSRNLQQIGSFDTLLTNRANAMMCDVNAPKIFWDEAIRTASYLWNRTPISLSRTPEEEWTQQEIGIKNLKVWGCKILVPIFKGDGVEGKIGCFLGYKKSSNSYKYFDPSSREFFVHPSLTFKENETISLWFAKRDTVVLNNYDENESDDDVTEPCYYDQDEEESEDDEDEHQSCKSVINRLRQMFTKTANKSDE